MSAAISFSLENTNVKGPNKATVFLTDDPTVNKLTISLSNTGEEDFALKGGAPVQENQRGAESPAGLYVNFGAAIPVESTKAMVFTAEGWAAKYFAAENGETWALSPVADLTIPAGEKVVFNLDNLMTEKRSNRGTLSIGYYGFGPSSPDVFQESYFIQPPPVEGLKELDLKLGFVRGGNVAVTTKGSDEIQNEISFTLRNPDPDHPVVGPGAPAPAGTPIFYLSFVSGESPGYESLATKEHIKLFTVKQVAVNPKESWRVTGPADDPGSGAPKEGDEAIEWALEPSNPEVLGTGASGIVKFSVSQIVSYLQPGPTLLYLQYQNIPGYNDGYLSLAINKYLMPAITAFSADPSYLLFKHKDQDFDVTFSWAVSHPFTNLRIHPVYQERLASRNLVRSLAAGPFGTTLKKVDRSNLDWILSVDDVISGRTISKTCHINGDFTSAHLEIIVAPRKLDFSKSHDVTVSFTWRATGIETGPFLNGNSVKPKMDSYDYKISESSLAAPSDIPDLPGKVMVFSATNLMGEEVASYQFIPKCNWPIHFPNIESIIHWKKTANPAFTGETLKLYNDMVFSWQKGVLPTLTTLQGDMLVFVGKILHGLKLLQAAKGDAIWKVNDFVWDTRVAKRSNDRFFDELITFKKRLELFNKNIEELSHQGFVGAVYQSLLTLLLKQNEVVRWLVGFIKRNAYYDATQKDLNDISFWVTEIDGNDKIIARILKRFSENTLKDIIYITTEPVLE